MIYIYDHHIITALPGYAKDKKSAIKIKNLPTAPRSWQPLPFDSTATDTNHYYISNKPIY